MASVDVPGLVEQARAGQSRAVARLISLVEQESSALAEVAARLTPHAGHAHIIGLTGAPGVGKSTLSSALVSCLRTQGRRVGVLAVDPSSSFSGGALLGDRVRMQDHAVDTGVFIRSMATRGHLGGLSAAAPQAIRVLDGAGCDVVLVETVGVGQSEIEIASLADTSIVLVAPGMGDGIQAAKAGVLEVGDIFVINKADRDGATATRRELRSMLSMVERSEQAWKPPVRLTVASNGDGIDDVIAATDDHLATMRDTGELLRRRLSRMRGEIEALALGKLREKVNASADLDGLAERVNAGSTDTFSAADYLVSQL